MHVSPENVVDRGFQGIYALFAKKLKHVKSIIKTYSYERELPLRVELEELLRPPLLSGTFPSEIEVFKSAVDEVIESAVNMRGEIANIFENIRELTELGEGNDETTSQKSLGDELFSILLREDSVYEQITLKWVNTLTAINEAVTKLQRRPSFTMAIPLQVELHEAISKLNDRGIFVELEKTGVVDLEEEFSHISSLHMCWARLVDEHISYIDLGGRMADLVNNTHLLKLFNKVIQKEGDSILRALQGRDKVLLVGILHDLLNEARASYELVGIWSRYLSEHVLALDDTLRSINVEIDEDILKGYLNVCLENLGILEYELYNLLVKAGIPSIPRIRLNHKKEDGTQEIYEVDVLALKRTRGFALIEITVRKTQEDILDKIEKLISFAKNLEGDFFVAVPEDVFSSLIKGGKGIKYEKSLVPLERPRCLIERLLIGATTRPSYAHVEHLREQASQEIIHTFS
ncbi:MAG: hypothetical protein NZ954_08565 [Thermofilaceae archaeon]|nr:hypothetical protein [Thermofilaceae archaeon]